MSTSRKGVTNRLSLWHYNRRTCCNTFVVIYIHYYSKLIDDIQIQFLWYSIQKPSLTDVTKLYLAFMVFCTKANSIRLVGETFFKKINLLKPSFGFWLWRIYKLQQCENWVTILLSLSCPGNQNFDLFHYNYFSEVKVELFVKNCKFCYWKARP